jgi:hypothetical protein
MQRALTSSARASIRSSSSKLRPLASAGFNAQQLRFAHKVRLNLSAFPYFKTSSAEKIGNGMLIVYGMIRSSSLVLRLEQLCYLVSRP